MTQQELKDLLSRYKLRPDKTFGQNFLLNDEVLDEMIIAAEVGKQDTVLEVGPGIGNLTQKLAREAGHVLAIEKDLRLKELLADLEAKHANLHIEFADILRHDFVNALTRVPLRGRGEASSLRYKVVANIPYYVTGKLVQLFLRSPSRPQSITVLVQKEVAENMVATPGKTNLLSLSVQLVANARIVRIVPAADFYPAPKVHSAIVHMDLFKQSPYGTYDEKLVFRVARACFSGKRKQIHNTLANNLHLSVSTVEAVLKKAGVPKDTRPQALSVQQFLALTEAVALCLD